MLRFAAHVVSSVRRLIHLTKWFNIFSAMASRAHAVSSEERLNLVFHALADGTRRSLLRRLSRGAAMVTELAEPLPMSLPAVSKHLRVLERARLVTRRIDGRVHRCSLDMQALGEVEEWLRARRTFWKHSLDALAAHLEDPDA
jgi:DNA-binding transcriptional ArsR family regulator